MEKKKRGTEGRERERACRLNSRNLFICNMAEGRHMPSNKIT